MSYVLLNRFFDGTRGVLDLAVRAIVNIIPSSIDMTERLYAQLPAVRQIVTGKVEESEVEFVIKLTLHPNKK